MCILSACRLREIYDIIQHTLRLNTDDTLHLSKGIAQKVLPALDKLRKVLPGKAFSSNCKK